MQTQSLATLVTHQKPQLTSDVRVVVVHDVNNQHEMEAIVWFLEEAGYLQHPEQLKVIDTKDFGHERINGLLEHDQAVGNVSFFMITNGILKHYYKHDTQHTFSVRMTLFE